jgi:hypothetical protein
VDEVETWQRKVLGDTGSDYLVIYGPRRDGEWRWSCTCCHFRYRRPEGGCKHIRRAQKAWEKDMAQQPDVKLPNLGQLIRAAQSEGLVKLLCDPMAKISLPDDKQTPCTVRCHAVWKDGTEVALVAEAPTVEQAQERGVRWVLAARTRPTRAPPAASRPRQGTVGQRAAPPASRLSPFRVKVARASADFQSSGRREGSRVKL